MMHNLILVLITTTRTASEDNSHEFEIKRPRFCINDTQQSSNGNPISGVNFYLEDTVYARMTSDMSIYPPNSNSRASNGINTADLTLESFQQNKEKIIEEINQEASCSYLDHDKKFAAVQEEILNLRVMALDHPFSATDHSKVTYKSDVTYSNDKRVIGSESRSNTTGTTVEILLKDFIPPKSFAIQKTESSRIKSTEIPLSRIQTSNDSSTLPICAKSISYFPIDDYKERFFANCLQVLQSRNEPDLLTLLEELEICYQPKKIFKFMRLIREHKEECTKVNGFAYKYISQINIPVIESMILKSKEDVVDHYKDKKIEEFAKCVNIHFIDSDDTTNVAKYKRLIEQTCFMRFADDDKLLPRKELFKIVEFLPEFFHHLNWKMKAIESNNEKTELYKYLKDDYTNISELVDFFYHRHK